MSEAYVHKQKLRVDLGYADLTTAAGCDLMSVKEASCSAPHELVSDMFRNVLFLRLPVFCMHLQVFFEG